MNRFFQVELTKGLNLTEAVPEEIYQQWMPLLSSAGEGVKRRVELDVYLPDFYHLEVSVSPIKTHETVVGVSFFIRDITQKWRKKSWESLESKVLVNAYRNEPLTDVFDMLLSGIQEIAPSMTCYVTRKIENKLALEWVSTPSLPPSYIAAAPEIPIDPMFGSCGLSASTMQPAYVRDIREHSSWEKYRDITMLYGFYSCYSFPVISKEGRILGTLGVYFREPHDATEHELAIWQCAVNLVGILLEKENNEREVLRKNNQLDEIATSIPGVLYMIRMDPDGTREFEYISKKASQYLGRPLDSIGRDYKSVVSLMKAEYLPDLQKELERSLRDKNDAEFEFSLREDINPEQHTYKLLSSHVFKKDGSVHTYGTIFDITGQKNTESLLKTSKEELEIILKCLNDLVFVVDADHRFVDAFANDESRFMVGKDSFIGRSLVDMFPPKITSQYMHAIETLKNGQETASFYYEMQDSDQRNFYRAQIKTVPDKSRYLVTVKDVTTERSVVEINDKLESVLDEAGDYGRFGIFEFNITTGRLLWSSQLRKVMGIPDTLNETNLFSYYLNAIHPDDLENVQQLITDASQHALDFQTEHRIRHYDGHYIWLLCKARCSIDALTGEAYIRGIAMDISQSKQAEEESKRKSNLLEAVSLLSMNIASDEMLDESIHNMLAKLGETIGVSRINVFRNKGWAEPSGLTGELLFNWNATGVPSLEEDVEMQEMNVEDTGFGDWVPALKEGKPVYGDVETMPETIRQFLSKRNIKTLLIIPVQLDGVWWGFVSFEVINTTYRWQEDEISIFSAVSNLIGSVIERKRVRDNLVKSEMFQRSVVETMAEGLIIMNTDRYAIDCNPAAEAILRMPRAVLMNIDSAQITSNLKRLDGTYFNGDDCPAFRSMHSGQPVVNEVMGFSQKGAPELWVSVNASPLKNPLTGEIIGAVETFTDITERVMKDRELLRNLSQKEVLLKEVHHRVKNNLAIVSSLLQLQQLYTKDDLMKNMLQESQGRLRSMSLVHELLYKNGDFSRIPFDSYLKEIGEYLKSTFAKPHQEILFEISTDECDLEITKAIPCGLIVNELVTNAFKYAFADRNEGLVVISLRRNGEYFVLEVCDDGPGLPAGLDWKTAKTMGFTLVRTLSEQLKGALNIENKNGARLVLTFPK